MLFVMFSKLQGFKASRTQGFKDRKIHYKAQGRRLDGSEDSYLNLGMKAERIERFIALKTGGLKVNNLLLLRPDGLISFCPTV